MDFLILGLVVGIVFFQFVDGWTTLQVIKAGGYESNKLEAQLMHWFGVRFTLFLTKGYVVIFVLTGAWFGWWKLTWSVAGLDIPLVVLLVALFGLYYLVVSHNLEQYKPNRGE